MPMSLAKLLREARKAASKEDYIEAELLYDQVLDFADMRNDLDIRLRMAFCAAKNGHLEKAKDAYMWVIQRYQDSGDEGAAAALEQLMASLAQESEESSADKVDLSQALSDEDLMHELCEMGELSIMHSGDVLCRTGDMPEVLWLLQKGSMTVRMPDYDEPDSIKSVDGHLTLVGELGFFTSQRRSADVIADGLVEIHAVRTTAILEREKQDVAFKSAMRKLLLERWAEPVLTRHEVFERVNDVDRMRIVHSFDRVNVGPGQTLIESGEEHPYAYLLQSGCMFFMHPTEQPDDSVDSADGSAMTSIFPGDMIHLGGLVKGYKSQYRVVTGTPVQLLRLSLEDFEPFTYRRPWIIQAIHRFSQRPASLQVMKPDDDYLWKANRHVKTRAHSLKSQPEKVK